MAAPRQVVHPGLKPVQGVYAERPQGALGPAADGIPRVLEVVDQFAHEVLAGVVGQVLTGVLGRGGPVLFIGAGQRAEQGGAVTGPRERANQPSRYFMSCSATGRRIANSRGGCRTAGSGTCPAA
jgi:hypothetical protein